MSNHSICAFPNCGRKVHCSGLCNGHRQQANAGKPLKPLWANQRERGTPPRMPYLEAPCPNPTLIGNCRIWQARKDRKGYGVVRADGKTRKAHRYAWQLAKGPIPTGMVIDHLCRNRACINPDHLRVVTCRINAVENSLGNSALYIARTHCKNGHPFSEANTLIRTDGGRRCRICLKETNQRNWQCHKLRTRNATKVGLPQE